MDVNLFPDITRILFARFEGNRAAVDATDTTGSFDGLHPAGGFEVITSGWFSGELRSKLAEVLAKVGNNNWKSALPPSGTVTNGASFQTLGMILKGLHNNQEFSKENRRNFFTMSDDISTMKSALRVLMAITDRVEPTPTDVAELHRIAPECSDLPPDELACELVQRALKKRRRASGNEKMNEANYPDDGGTLGKIDAIGVDEIKYAKGHNYLTLVYEIDLGITVRRFRLTSPVFQP